MEDEERQHNNNQPIDNSTYGDHLSDIVDEDYLRIGFLNVNGLKQEGWKQKNKAIITTIRRYNFDVMGLAEVNIHWPKVNHTDRWEDRIAPR